MTNAALGILRDTAARVPLQPCFLRPPLRTIWSFVAGGGPPHVPVIGERYAFGMHDDDAVALDLDSGDKQWTYKRKRSRAPSGRIPRLVDRELLVESFVGETENYDALNPDTGELVRSFAHSCGPDAVIEGGLVIGGFGSRLTAISRSTGRLAWRKDFGEDPGAWIAGALATTPTQVIVGVGAGVTAFGVADGRERFHASFDDLTAGSKSTGRVRGPVVVAGDLALVELTSGFLVAVSLRGGQRRWVVEGGALDGYLYRDRYYRLSPRRYQIVDASSGRLLLERAIRLPPALVRDAGSPDRPILVSETHVFTGSRTGFVFAFERDSGKYVWSTRPTGARGTYHTANYFTTTRGRLIYGDVSGMIYCLGQPEDGTGTQTPADSTRPGRRRAS